MSSKAVQTVIPNEAIKLIDWAGRNLTHENFLDLVQESIKWGPIPTLKGDLYEIYESSVSQDSWRILGEMESWGAATIYRSEDIESACLIADAVQVELILLAIKKILDMLTGKSACQARTPSNKCCCSESLIPKPPRKHFSSDSSLDMS